MTPEQIIEILKTRQAIANTDGNPTEISLISELLKMAEELNKLKGDD